MYRLENLRQQGIEKRKCFDFLDGQIFEIEECPVRKGLDAFFVSADGETYPCGFLANNPLGSLGSVRNFSLMDLQKKTATSCKTIASDCIECELYKVGRCHGGCPARIYSLYKKSDAVDIYCMAKFFQEERMQ